MIRTCCLCLGFSLFLNGLKAQFSDTYRPKIAEFSIEGLMDYYATSTSESFGNSTQEINSERLIKAKLGIPLLIKDNRMLGVQLKHYQQQINFDVDDAQLDYDLYEHLDDRTLSSTGARLFYQREKGSGKFSFVAGAELNSDQGNWNPNSTNYFISSTYTFNHRNGTNIGFGLVAGRAMRITSVVPLFIYERPLGRNWTLDMTLPKYISTRKKINSSNYLIAKTQFRGWRYNLTNAVEGANQDLTLRKADLQFSLSWEHELHDWLWFGVDVGYTKNLNYYLADPGMRRRDALIDVASRDATYAKFSIFLVPPRKFYRK